MERQDYPAMLPSLQPPQAVDILNDRVRQVGALNVAIADWLQERRRLEEQYSSGLRKLARKNIEGVDLGVFSIPWDTIKTNAESLADSHSSLASKIEVDVEQPLRAFQSKNRELQNISSAQGSLGALAKDVERAQQKAEKVQNKGDRADVSRVVSASDELDGATRQWESQAPFIYAQLQGLDEVRLNTLRDALTQFQTHEMDAVEKNRGIVEQCLNILLNVEVADEIKTFALKTVSAPPRSRQSAARAPDSFSGIAGASSSYGRPGMGAAQPSQDRMSVDGSEDTPSGKNRFSRLKRFSTVMQKKRESKIPAGALPPMAEAPENKDKGKRFKLPGRKSSTPSLDVPEGVADGRSRSPFGIGRTRTGSSVLEPTAEEPRPPPTRGPEQVNGVPSATTSPSGAPQLPALNGGHQSDLAGLEPPAPSQPTEATQAPSALPARDNEGFSVPPAALDPISQAQQDAAATGADVAPQYNVNIQDKPVPGGGAADDAAMAALATKLQTQAPPVARRNGTTRGRRQDRNSMAVTPDQSSTPVAAPTTTFQEPTASAAQAAVQPPRQSSLAYTTSPQEADLHGAFPGPNAAQQPLGLATSTSEPQKLGESEPTSRQLDSSGASLPTQSSQPYPSVIPGAVAVGAAGVAATGAAAASLPFSPMSPDASSPFRPTSRAATGMENAVPDNQSIRSGRSLTSTTSQTNRHPELNDVGLTVSIIDTISARIENGQVTTSSLIGEMAMAFHSADATSTSNSEIIRLDNFSTLEKVAPNPAFATPVPDRVGEYTIDLKPLSKAQVAFKYQAGSESAAAQAPLLITPAFRIEATQASVIVSYAPNPAFIGSSGPVTVTNAMLALTLEGTKATSCQSKPVGTFSRERNMIFWQIGDITLAPGAAPQKLLARFATESEAKSGTVEAKWEISGEQTVSSAHGLSVSQQVISTAADPFADENAVSGTSWKPVNTVKKLISGNYVAKS